MPLTQTKNWLIGTSKPLILSLFLPNRECDQRKTALAFVSVTHYAPADAQVPRHTPHTRRVTHADRSDAMAFEGAAPSAGGQRQARSPLSLRRTCVPAGAHGPHGPAAGLHRC